MRTSVSTKSALVKKFTPPTIRLDINGDLPKATQIDKPKEKRGRDGRIRTTPYYYKLFSDGEDVKQYLATIETTGASLLRLVFGPSFTPKDRVYEHPGERAKPYVLSRTIRFTPAGKLPHEKHIEIIEKQQRGLAKLFTSLLCFEDPDMHAHNWGLDEKGNLIKIDHDRMFSSFSNKFQGTFACFNGETDVNLLMSWKNLAYKDFFKIISPEDILSLPLLVDAKPYNYPFRFKIYPQTSNRNYSPQELAALRELEEITKKLGILSKDNDFIRWRFFYLTKYLLLITPEDVRKIIASHSIGSDKTDDEFCQHILERHLRIKDTLFSMPEYQHYFNTEFKKQWLELVNEIMEYNQEFRDKKTEKIKPHKKEFVIDLRDVETNLAALTEDLRRATSTNTPEKMAQREIELDIARIQQETFAIKNLTGVFFRETSKHDQATVLSQNPHFRELPPQLTTSEKKTVNDFLKSFSDEREIKNYFAENPRGAYASFFNCLAQKSKMHLNVLEHRLGESRLFVNSKIESLMTKYSKILSTSQLESIWNSYEHCSMDDKVHVLIQLIENCPFENIPASLFQWMIQFREKIESMRSDFLRYPIFHQLHVLITNCHQLSTSSSQQPLLPTRELPSITPNSTVRATTNVLRLLQDPTHQLILPEKELSDFAGPTASHLLCHRANSAGFQYAWPGNYSVKLCYENREFVLQSEPQITPRMTQGIFASSPPRLSLPSLPANATNSTHDLRRARR